MARKTIRKSKAATSARTARTTAAKTVRTRASAPARARTSPGKLRLTMLTGDYEIVRALKDGTVRPEGIDLVIADYRGASEIHKRVAAGKGADINEFNGGHFVVQRAHGREDFTAIPVFLHRRFRHGFIYINRSMGRIREPSDLIGKRIGSTSIGAAANYWMRGYLEQAGVPHRSVTWVVDHFDDTAEQAPRELKIERAPAGGSVAQMLLDGEIDGVISPSIDRMIDERDPRVGRLWPNYKQIEIDYFRRTGLFPIMHVTTVPSRIVLRHPWVVRSLTLAFEEAKQLCYQRVINPRVVPLAWFRAQWEEERQLLGPDPWEYGMSDANRRNYGQLVRYVQEQVLTGPAPTLEDLFAKESFEIELPLPKFHATKYGF